MRAVDTDLTMQVLSMQLGKTQMLAQIAIIKKNHEMEMALIDMVDQAVRSAPAPKGQGLLVDRRA
ncbi:MAG: hypothetical protein ABIO40_00790 [Devosia sp.]